MTSRRPLWRAVMFAAVTPLLEKRVLNGLALDTPVAFSVSRVIVLVLGLALLGFARALVERFDISDLLRASVKYDVEPHKFDDHWEDA